MSADMGKRQSHVFFSFLSLHREEGGKKISSSSSEMRHWKGKKDSPDRGLDRRKNLSLSHTHTLTTSTQKEEGGERRAFFKDSFISSGKRKGNRLALRLDKIWILKTLPLLARCMMVCTIVHVRWGGEKEEEEWENVFIVTFFSFLSLFFFHNDDVTTSHSILPP